VAAVVQLLFCFIDGKYFIFYYRSLCNKQILNPKNPRIWHRQSRDWEKQPGSQDCNS